MALLGTASAYVRIRINGNTLYWQDPVAISWRWSAAGSEDVDDGSDAAALARAFEVWEAAPSSLIGFLRQADTVSRDTGGNSHLVVFDEDGSSGWFPVGSGAVALTPISYATNDGRILDADILFNGRDFTFSTDLSAGTFDIQDVATHEIGHFIGLDHTPTLSATMWPWVSGSDWRHRSLSEDDVAGAGALAARGNPGRLTGVVQDFSGGLLIGARISALSIVDFDVIATALSGDDGSFTMRGVPVGDYHLHVAPVSAAFTSGNLSGSPQLDSDFGAVFWGGWASPTVFPVTAGANTSCGTLNAPDEPTLRESSAGARQLRPGETQWVAVPMTGAPAGTLLEARGPWLSAANTQQFGNALRAEVSIAAGAPAGVWDLYLRTPAGETAVASGAVEVVAQPPILGGLDVVTGMPSGGETITLHGARFQLDGWVVFGGLESPAVEWVDAQTLRAMTPSAAPGVVDVVVINADGQESRLEDGFRYTDTPELGALFPTAGNTRGLTRIYLHGSGFGPDTEVLLDGIPQATQLVAPNVLQAVTQPHPAGAVDLELRNPQAPPELHPVAFRYVEEPDPVVSSFTPDRGPRGGGTRVALRGHGLGGAVAVRFGVDPVSGVGGASAGGMEILDDEEVAATTPANTGLGSFGVSVTTDTGQGALVSGFTFQEESGSSGGGCAGTVDGAAPVDPIAGLIQLGLLPLAWWLMRRRLRRVPATVAA